MTDVLILAALLTQGLICEDEVAQAVDAYLSEPSTTHFVTFGGHRLDLAEAVKSHPYARETACTPWISQKLKREVVRDAILKAPPLRG